MTTHDEAREMVRYGCEELHLSLMLAYIDECELAERESCEALRIGLELNDSLLERAETAELEKIAAIHEMAKARGLAQDAQSRYDWLCYGQHVETEERGGEFQRLYLKLQAALKRSETAELENERLRAALDAVRSVLIAENDARPALVIAGIVDQFGRGATAEELAVQRENWARGELELAKDPAT